MTVLPTIIGCAIGIIAIAACGVYCIARDMAQHGHDWRQV